MTLIPEFKIGLWNGWWFTVSYLIIHFLPVILYPKSVTRRFLAQPKSSKTEKSILLITTTLYFGIMIYAIFVSLKLNTAWFRIGLVIYIVGMVFYVIAVDNYARTPLDQPAVKGLYRISRNPIHVMSFIAWLGAGIALASGVILAANVLMMLLMHITTLAEERFCLEKYGDTYRNYMKKTPRYFLFF